MFLFIFLFITLPLGAQESHGGSFLARINDLRQQNNLSILSYSQELETVGTQYGLELRTQGRLSHTDVHGQGPAQRVQALVPQYWRVGEILGAGKNNEDILQAWLQSPSHRKVLLNPDWNKVGIGETLYSGGKILVVLFVK